MRTIQDMLSGGNLRSLGKSAHVVKLVLSDKSMVAALFEGLRCDDPVVRMRCADVLEKVSAKMPRWLDPFCKEILESLPVESQKEIRWHLAVMVARLKLTSQEQDIAIRALLAYTSDASSIVKTMAMQGLADIAKNSPRHRDAIMSQIEQLMATGTPAMKARGRRLLSAYGPLVTDRNDSAHDAIGPMAAERRNKA